MKMTFRMILKVKGATKKFNSDFEIGELATQEVEYDITEEQSKSAMFAVDLIEKADEFRDNLIEVEVVEVK